MYYVLKVESKLFRHEIRADRAQSFHLASQKLTTLRRLARAVFLLLDMYLRHIAQELVSEGRKK